MLPSVSDKINSHLCQTQNKRNVKSLDQEMNAVGLK